MSCHTKQVVEMLQRGGVAPCAWQVISYSSNSAAILWAPTPPLAATEGKWGVSQKGWAP